MPNKRQKPNPEPVQVVSQANGAAQSSHGFSSEAEHLATALFDACAVGDSDCARRLVEQGADAWVQSAEGWTALHAAASAGDVELVEFLLRKGNAVWNVIDNIGMTAGDLSWSLNRADVYEFLLGEGVRSEMIRAVMGPSVVEADGDEVEEGAEADLASDTAMTETGPRGDAPAKSTASDNATFLASRLVFSTDVDGQEVCRDVEGNGVMMGWERDIMRETAAKLCAGRGGQDEDEEFNVVNVGFGLGIIDTFLQEYSPTTHLIIEPHPDVLAHARSKGWYDKAGVRFYEGTWQDYLADLESEKETYAAFDAVYFDTYSEHYADLHAFFDALPNLLRSSSSRFSFFHGLGATSRLLYDVYTQVSELHLLDTGLKTEWSEVDVIENLQTWDAVERRYWGDVGPYRLPLCWLEM